MNTFMNGFGDVAIQSTAVAKPSVWDSISNVLTKVVQPAANVYTQIKTNKPANQTANTSMYPNQNFPAAPPAPAQEKTDNTMKYAVLGGVGLLAATGIYFATRKRKK